METKEMKVSIPKGYEIDKENSTFECIKFKKKLLTYKDVARELFYHKSGYYIPSSRMLIAGDYAAPTDSFATDEYTGLHNATSKKQLEKLLAINKIMNVAKYLNGKDWKPDWKDDTLKYRLYIGNDNYINISNHKYIHDSVAYFRTEELAKEAIKILGEDTIRLALSADW